MSSTPDFGALTLDQYIRALLALKASGVPGSTIVQKWLPSRGRHNAPPPVEAYMLARVVHKDAKPVMHPTAFWQEAHDRPEWKGELVVRV